MGAHENAARLYVAQQCVEDGAVTALKAAEQSGQTEAVTACLVASAQYAPLLGSIAACRATHVEVLSA